MRKKLLFALLSILLLPLGVMAQNSSVSISPSSGNMLAGVAGGYNEWGVQRGWSSMWQHEQLSLTFNVSDYPDLTEGGQLANPAGNMCEYNNHIVVMGGSAQDCYWTVALPKGFRMTGYEISLLNDLDGKTVNQMDVGSLYDEDGNSSRVKIDKWLYETGADFDVTHAITQSEKMPGFSTGTNNDTKEYVITRETTGPDDMGNILYFVVHHDGDGFYGLTIKSFKIFFTAEANFVENVAPVAPQEVSSEGASFMNYEFATQKVDVGELNPRTFETGNTYLVYDYSAVNDLKANIVLYEDDAVSSGAVGENGLKGITATRNGDEYYYALKNNVYYVEAPTNAKTQKDKNVNMAYRITGAKIKYNFGQKETEHQYNYTETVIETKTRNGFRIYIEIRGTRYYLDPDGNSYAYNEANAPLWQKDENGYLHCGDVYLTMDRNYYVGTGTRTEAQNSSWPTTFTITDNGNIYYTYTTGGWWPETVTRYLSLDERGLRFLQNNNGYRYKAIAATEEYEEEVTYPRSVTIPAFTPSEYTIKVFKTTEPTTPDEDGNYAETDYIADKEVEVSATEPSGEITLEDLNNDAIKFEITGLPEGGKALVTVELTLQPLNPYISRLDIVCHDPNVELNEALRKTMTQTFIAEDFAVRGGKFVFYVPVGFDNKINEDGTIVASNQKCSFTFENLHHTYGDNTYYDGTGTGHARYFLVRSEYEQNYPSAYGSDPGADYEDKISAIVSGTTKFNFSNAAALDHSSSSSSHVNYEEYPFSVATYTSQGGNFTNLELKNGENDVRYLFTADETRYNIATTTTTEHRSYAFYTMDIQLITKTYEPAHEWIKVYDSSFYLEDGVEVTKPMYGLKLLTEKVDGEYGYLTSDQINRILNNNDAATYYSGEYTPLNNRPSDITNKKQVLYIDASELQAVVYKTVVAEGEYPDLIQIQKQIGENGLFFLPEGVTFDADNFAYRSGSNFRTGENIIITDKCPFYSPYTITVSSPHYATYTRQVTTPTYDKAVNATVMLPFTLTLNGEGVHQNPTGENTPGSGLKFTVNNLSGNDITPKDGSTYLDTDEGTATFAPLTATSTEANKPYMIMVTDDPQGEKISFIATQEGATVAATEHGTKANNHTGELIEGATNEVSFKNVTSTFVNYASFSGARFNRNNNNIFYFANNMYVTMKELRDTHEFLYSYPFRGIYSYTPGTPSREFTLKRFEISYEEPGLGSGDVTGINNNWMNNADLKIRSEKGNMTLTATKAQEVTIYSSNGSTAAKIYMQGGDSKTVNLPSGLYVVNNVKIIVK